MVAPKQPTHYSLVSHSDILPSADCVKHEMLMIDQTVTTAALSFRTKRPFLQRNNAKNLKPVFLPKWDDSGTTKMPLMLLSMRFWPYNQCYHFNTPSTGSAASTVCVFVKNCPQIEVISGTWWSALFKLVKKLSSSFQG